MTAIAFPDLDRSILSRRDEIIAGLSALLPRECLVTSDDERRAFETDALTAYRKLPLAVALPRTTEEAAAVMRYCFEHGVKVVARGAGTSLSGGAIPQEDAIVICVAKMTRILSVDYANRAMRVESGVTNLGITEAVMADGFFYAPDPSSQLACTIAGNIGMNSGGAHCLKYGVTTNNVLGVRLVLVDGTIVEIGGDHLDSPGLDLLGLMIGSEGQLGIVTEATVRILRSAEGARPVLFGFPTSEEAGACVADIIGNAIIPVAIEFMDKLAIEICESFAHAGYPLDVGALLDRRSRRLRRGDGDAARKNRRDCQEAWRDDGARVAIRDGSRGDLEGPQIRVRCNRPHCRLHLHGRHGSDRTAFAGFARHG